MEAATPLADLDRAVARLSEGARGFARTAPREKAALLRASLPRLGEIAGELVERVCRARGLDPAGPAAAEAWLGGPAPVVAYARELAESLEEIAGKGRPAPGARDIRARADGRVAARLAGRSGAERAVMRGRDAMALFAAGVRFEDVIAGQAAFYRRSDPEGAVAAVIGAEDDAATGMLEALYALFVEGQVVVLALGGEAASRSDLVVRALAPIIERGALEVIHGGAEEALYVAMHAGVAAVHFSGEAETYEPIAAAGRPGTAALGGVGPVIVVPCLYAKDELAFVAGTVAAAVAAGDRAAPRVLVLAAGWAQRALFLDLVGDSLSRIPPRPAPNARAGALFAELTEGRRDAVRFGVAAGADAYRSAPSSGALPWTVLPDLDPSAADPIFTRTGAVGPVLAAVSLGHDDPARLLEAATAFCNERLGGSLGAQIVAHPIHIEDTGIGGAIERAVIELRYGAVGVNQWPGLVRLTGALPWGGHPSATHEAPRSGLGFRNGARMLACVDKAVIHGPLLPLRAPAHIHGRDALRTAARMTAFQAAPRVRDVPALCFR